MSLILEIVETESYLKDMEKLQEEVKIAENELSQEREKEKGIVQSY